MTIFILAAFATCVSALAALTLVGLTVFNTLRPIEPKREKHHELDSHDPSITQPSYRQEQHQERIDAPVEK